MMRRNERLQRNSPFKVGPSWRWLNMVIRPRATLSELARYARARARATNDLTQLERNTCRRLDTLHWWLDDS